MFDIFPDIKVNNFNEDKIFCEYAWDFEKDDFIFQNGRPIKIEGLPAIKVWVYKALKTSKGSYLAYYNFGNEFESLMGSSYIPEIINAEIERFTKECLYQHPDITNLYDFNSQFNGDELSISFTMETKYGNMYMEEKFYV